MKKLRFALLLAGCATLTLTLSASAAPVSSFALDSVFGDHMVLQRNRPLRFSGSAQAGMIVSVTLAEKTAKAVADEHGRWSVELPPMAEGGPYEVRVGLASDGVGYVQSTILLEDVMVGEVWLASGQSNMEFWVLGNHLECHPFYHLPDGEAFAAEKDSDLRILCVPRGLSVDGECSALPGGTSWKRADTRAARGRCSAVALWFATYLRQYLGNVPVGIVSSSWGGTPIEAWIPEGAFRAANDTENLKRLDLCRPPAYPFTCDRLQDAKTIREQRQRDMDAWLTRFYASDPETTRLALADWAKPDLDLSGWKIGQRSDMDGLRAPGIVWYRFAFDVPESWKGAAIVHLDCVNDCDETFLDGQKVGATGIDTANYWCVPRDYRVSDVTPGRHVIALRVQNHFQIGMIGNHLWIENASNGQRINFSDGNWCERIEFRADAAKIGLRPPAVDCTDPEPRYSTCAPSTLYNAMVAPVTPLTIGGAIWYQGCANADDIGGYPRLQKMLIDAWRERFRNPEMTFVLTQLSAFQAHQPMARLPDDFWKALDKPSDCVGFGAFRVMQDTLRTYPKTGVACTIDIGDHSDIHPTNKKEVGRRLANEAMRLAFGKAAFAAGPRAVSAERKGAAVVVRFENVGAGLTLGEGVRTFNPHLFALAGADGKFRWAEGCLQEDGTVVVRAEGVAEPVRVQYCVSAYPPNVCFRRTEDALPVYPFDLTVGK